MECLNTNDVLDATRDFTEIDKVRYQYRKLQAEQALREMNRVANRKKTPFIGILATIIALSFAYTCYKKLKVKS